MDTFGPHEDTCAARHAPGGRSDDILDHHYDSGPEFAEDYAEGDEALSGLGLGNDLSDPAPRPDADPPLPAALLEATGTNKAGTNVVERGVDEPDVVKVDGTRLLRLWGFLPPGADGADPAQPVDEWQLSVLGAGADRPRLLGSVGPRERHVAHELFLLSDHRVLVLGSVTQRSPRRGDRPDTPKVVLTLLDTADAVAPQVLRTAKVTGRYVSARMTDGVVRVVLATSAPIEVSAPVGREPRVLAEVRNTGMLHRYKGTDWLLGREILDSHGDLVAEGPAMACSDVHRPAAPRSPDLLSVLTVDSLDGVDALDRAGGSALVGGGDTLYAGTDRLYVAASGTDPSDRDPEDGLQRRDGTAVHAFDLTGRRASPAACRGSAPGDDVKAVRWFGPPATIVTFRQRDPFYVVDLSLPAAPRVLGALEIPGYSGYLHPVGDGRVIGVGQDADLEGSSTALQVSVFDVTDPTLPRRTANLDLGFGTAAAEADSRAFTYLPDRRLALVPAWLGTSAACPARRDPPCWILVRGEETRDVPRSRHFGDRSPAVPAVTGVVVDTSGGLRELGRFLTGASVVRVVRVVPVGERLAVVTWSSVIMLDPDDMKPLGSVVLDGRDGITRS